MLTFHASMCHVWPSHKPLLWDGDDTAVGCSLLVCFHYRQKGLNPEQREQRWAQPHGLNGRQRKSRCWKLMLQMDQRNKLDTSPMSLLCFQGAEKLHTWLFREYVNVNMQKHMFMESVGSLKTIKYHNIMKFCAYEAWTNGFLAALALIGRLETCTSSHKDTFLTLDYIQLRDTFI